MEQQTLKKYSGSFAPKKGVSYSGSLFPDGTIMKMKTRGVYVSVNKTTAFEVSFDDESVIDSTFTYTFSEDCKVAILQRDFQMTSDSPHIVSNITTSAAYGKGNYLISADATAGAIVVTLPSATVGYNYTYTITKTDLTANTVKIESVSTIAGEVFVELHTKFEALTVFSNGTEWRLG